MATRTLPPVSLSALFGRMFARSPVSPTIGRHAEVVEAEVAQPRDRGLNEAEAETDETGHS